MTDHKKAPDIIIHTPQFERPRGAPPPAAPPADATAWEALRAMDRRALRELGLGQWNNPNDTEDEDAEMFGDGMCLMLLPGEWYRHIPPGFELVCISGEREPFCAGATDDDIRFGCLAYGLLVKW